MKPGIRNRLYICIYNIYHELFTLYNELKIIHNLGFHLYERALTANCFLFKKYFKTASIHTSIWNIYSGG